MDRTRVIDLLKRTIIANNFENPLELEYLAALLRREGIPSGEARIGHLIIRWGSDGYEIKIENHVSFAETEPATIIHIDYYNEEGDEDGDGYDPPAKSPVIRVWGDKGQEEATDRIDISRAYEEPE